MYEQIIKKAIEDLNIFNPQLNLEIKERITTSSLGESSEKITEITILRNKEPLYVQGYYTKVLEYREHAFQRMFGNLIMSGLVNQPTVRQIKEKGYTYVG